MIDVEKRRDALEPAAPPLLDQQQEALAHQVRTDAAVGEERRAVIDASIRQRSSGAERPGRFSD